EPVTLGPHPGRQLIVSASGPSVKVRDDDKDKDKKGAPERKTPWMSGGSGKVIARFYLAHGRLFVVAAAGRNFESRQPNVKRLFDSFEILDPASGPPTPPPSRPQPPTSDPAKPADLPPGWVEDVEPDLG